MSIDPTRVEYDCGRDIYGRRVRLIYSKDYCGRRAFEIIVDPYNQRDDGERLQHCLTADNLKAMAAVAEKYR